MIVVNHSSSLVWKCLLRWYSRLHFKLSKRLLGQVTSYREVLYNQPKTYQKLNMRKKLQIDVTKPKFDCTQPFLWLNADQNCHHFACVCGCVCTYKRGVSNIIGETSVRLTSPPIIGLVTMLPVSTYVVRTTTMPTPKNFGW